MPFAPPNNNSRIPGEGRIPSRLVLDTNVWLDWLVFGDPAAAPIRAAVSAGRAAIFIDDPCAAELARVLAYPLGRHSLDPAAQAAALAECRRLSQRIESLKAGEIPAGTTRLPRCRDPDDQKFLEAAAAARADMLITKDEALLELGRRKTKPSFRILTPHDFVLAS